MEKIESNDLLISILLHLPLKSIFRFLCVSKRWSKTLKDPVFFQSYTIATKRKGFSPTRPLAYIEINRSTVLDRSKYPRFFSKDDHSSPSQPPMNFLSVDQTNNHKFEKIPNFFGYFISCSDGLILCGRHPKTYHILNPIRGTSVALPPPKNYGYPSLGLACEENAQLVPDFKVVRAGVRTNEFTNTVSIQTYSSKTRKWSNSRLIGTGNFTLHAFRPPVVFNGVFHWFSWNATLAVYDSNDVCDQHMQLIILPYDVEQLPCTVTRSASDDVLWFGANEKECFGFWMLPRDGNGGGYKRSTTIPKTEWILMHTISYHSLHKEIFEDHEYIEELGEIYELDWMIPGEPLVAVLRIDEIIFLYNLETKSVELDTIEDLDEKNDNYCGNWVYPYMKPPSLSSYAL